jgi:hypothetical protein
MAVAALAVAALTALSGAPTPTTKSAVGPLTLEVPRRANAYPSIASAGSVVAIAWTATAAKESDVFVAVSRDGGVSFGSAVRVNATPGDAIASAEQPPRVTLGAAAGQAPVLTIVWVTAQGGGAIRMARSTDVGRTFSAADSVSPAGASGHRGWPAAAAGPNGESHVVWLDHGAGSWLRYHGPRGGGFGIAQGVCYCCKTALAAGSNGTLVAAWRHVYPDNVRDIAFATSRDGGATFTSATRVSADGWQINGCPDDGPALALDRGGAVHLVWPTVVSAPKERKAVFYATSRDGAGFSPRREVPGLGTDSASHPQIAVGPGNRVAIVWDERRDVGMVELMNGRFSGPVALDVADTASVYPAAAYSPSGLVVAWAAERDGRSFIAVSRSSPM